MASFEWDINHDIDWNEFEDLLGKLNWKSIDMNVNEVLDSEGDVNPWKTETNYASVAREISESCHLLKKFFEGWVRQIDISNVKVIKKLKFLFDSNEFIFLNFNYTSVLERIYGIKKVFHIHGETDDYRDLVVGHSGTKNFYLDDTEDEYMMMEANDSLRACHREMKKPFEKIINDNAEFFDSLSCVNNIYFYGFGFGNADLCYIKKIIKSCKKIENVYISNYQYINEKNKIEEALNLCGYSKGVLNMEL